MNIGCCRQFHEKYVDDKVQRFNLYLYNYGEKVSEPHIRIGVDSVEIRGNTTFFEAVLHFFPKLCCCITECLFFVEALIYGE